MSVERRAWSWRHRLLKSNLPSTTRHVLLTLSCHVNDAGEACFPRVEDLVLETGLSKRSVLTQLEIGRESGWVQVSRHGFSGKKWARNEYLLTTPEEVEGGERGAPISAEGGERGSPPDDEGGERGAPKVVNVVHHLEPHHIQGFSHSLLNNAIAHDGDEVSRETSFDRFWRCWPASPHKKRKADAKRKWVRLKLDREIDLILAHVASVITPSKAAREDGGQFLQGPCKYVEGLEWREARLQSAPGATAERVCVRCGAAANFKRGGSALCQTHFHEDDD